MLNCFQGRTSKGTILRDIRFELADLNVGLNVPFKNLVLNQDDFVIKTYLAGLLVLSQPEVVINLRYIQNCFLFLFPLSHSLETCLI